MAATFILTDSPRVRYATGSMMYFAQGIPAGLLSITIPAWLASEGVSAGDIGSYLAVIILPWVFKLASGLFMDRYQFLPMGRRRPWVLGAQAGLALSLLALMLIENPAEQIGLLMLVGVLINSFAATQDVAVDGMSIDLTPVREQGRRSFSSWSVKASASCPGLRAKPWRNVSRPVLSRRYFAVSTPTFGPAPAWWSCSSCRSPISGLRQALKSTGWWPISRVMRKAI